jgi:hypothetical protein
MNLKLPMNLPLVPRAITAATGIAQDRHVPRRVVTE